MKASRLAPLSVPKNNANGSAKSGGCHSTPIRPRHGEGGAFGRAIVGWPPLPRSIPANPGAGYPDPGSVAVRRAVRNEMESVPPPGGRGSGREALDQPPRVLEPAVSQAVVEP